MEHRRLLVDQCDVPAQIRQPHRAQVVTVQSDGPRVRVQHPQHESAIVLFPLPLGPTIATHSARRHLQADVLEHRRPRARTKS